MAELEDGVRALADGSPYAVTGTEHGFDVQVDVADARWYSLFRKEGLNRTFVHHVRVDDAKRSYTITDDSRTVAWEVGLDGKVPVLRGSAERTVGRTIELGRKKVWAWDEKLRYGKVLDYTLNTEESRALIRTAAQELGYRERMPGVVKFAVAMAVIGGVGGLAALVAVGITALAGKF